MNPLQQPVRTPVHATGVSERPHPIASEPLASRASLQVDPELPEITSARSLCGWHREFCVELLGEGAARIFVRAVQRTSFKASELQRATLFHRLDPRFGDLAGCVKAQQPELERLAATAQRALPSKANLFITVEYDRSAWDRVEQGVDRWARR